MDLHEGPTPERARSRGSLDRRELLRCFVSSNLLWTCMCAPHVTGAKLLSRGGPPKGLAAGYRRASTDPRAGRLAVRIQSASRRFAAAVVFGLEVFSVAHSETGGRPRLAVDFSRRWSKSLLVTTLPRAVGCNILVQHFWLRLPRKCAGAISSKAACCTPAR